MNTLVATFIVNVYIYYYNFTSDACMENEISKDSFQLDDNILG